MEQLVLQFWNTVNETCCLLSDKSIGVRLTEEEALLHAESCRSMTSYLKLQRLVLEDECRKREQKLEDQSDQ